MQKAWKMIQSGKSTILESSKSLAKIMHRSPACLYQKLLRMRNAQQDQQRYRAQQQQQRQQLDQHITKHRSYKQESSCSENCDSSDDPGYRPYSTQETRLLIDATQRILQGDLTMTEAVERLLGVMRHSKRGIDTKLRHMVTDSTAAAASGHSPSTSTPLLHQLSTAAHSGHTREGAQHHPVPTTATQGDRDPGNQSDAMSLDGLDCCWESDTATQSAYW